MEKTEKKDTHLEKGKKGEDLAEAFLIKKGFKIIKRNYRYGKSEIDIIAQTEKLLVFVEVKTRTRTDYGYPEAAITSTKASMIIRAAEDYIYRFNWKDGVRFDVVSVILKEDPEILHIKDAFY